jgi:DNA-binding helix-hairpin-helix protein with protein kinase domain
MSGARRLRVLALGGINERIGQLKALRRKSRKKQVAYLTCPWCRRERGGRVGSRARVSIMRTNSLLFHIQPREKPRRPRRQ